MKNVVIAEGGIGRRLNGTKSIITDEPETGVMDFWVDEDDRKTKTLYITQNGRYKADVDDDVYAYSKVTVSVRGGGSGGISIPEFPDYPSFPEYTDEDGNPLDPALFPEIPVIEIEDAEFPALIPTIETEDGVEVPIDQLFPEIKEDPAADVGEIKIPDTEGVEGSAITGIDPEDGYTYMVEVDENGNIEIEKVPTDIRAVDGTLQGEYEYGDTIDPTGLKFELIDKDGNVVKTREYPDGIIEWKPDGEIEIPTTDTSDADTEDVEWGGKKNDDICNAMTITYTPVSYSRMTFDGWVEETHYVSGVVGSHDGESVALGSGGGSGTFLVTLYGGKVYAMNLDGVTEFNLFSYKDTAFSHGWGIAATWIGATSRGIWVATPWSTSQVHAPESTILLSQGEMKPRKAWLRSNWDNPYNGRQLPSRFGVDFIDPLV